MSSCPGIGASSTSETVRRLDCYIYILRAITPRSSPDANSKSSDRKEMHWGKRRAATQCAARFHAGVWFATAARWRWTGAISVSLSLTFGIEPRHAERITGEHRDA